MDSIEELPKNKYKVTSYANFLTGINRIGRKRCTTVIESKYDLKKMEEKKQDVANVVWNDLVTNGHRMLGDVEVASIKLMKK